MGTLLSGCAVPAAAPGSSTPAASAPLVAAKTPSGSGWSQRGVFVFGPLLYDLRKNIWRYVSRSGGIEDCSDGSFYCLTGGPSVVLPRSCAIARAEAEWKMQGIRMRVAARHEEATNFHGLPPGRQDIVLLFREGSRWAVFEYKPEAGVLAIYFDPTMRSDIATAAATEGLEALRRRPDRYELVTLDPFGPCKKV
jgi:hypothetical protein